MIDVTEILEHWHAGRSQAEIAASLGVDRKTVRKYTAPAIAAGLTPGGAPVPEEQWVDLARQWFPELTDTRLRQSSWPAIEPFHEFVREQVGTVTISTVHQRLRDEHGLTVSLSSLRRYVAANLPAEAAAAAIAVLGEDPPPGREGEVDYGLLGLWYDPLRAARGERGRSCWSWPPAASRQPTPAARQPTGQDHPYRHKSHTGRRSSPVVLGEITPAVVRRWAYGDQAGVRPATRHPVDGGR